MNQAGVVHLIDARHAPTTVDLRLLDILVTEGSPILITLTKIDKLNRTKQKQALQLVTEQLEIEETQVVLTSSKTGKGKTELLEAIEILVQGTLLDVKACIATHSIRLAIITFTIHSQIYRLSICPQNHIHHCGY